jgi:DNA-binding ferritin-like protein
MTEFVGSSDSLLLFTKGAWGVVVDSEANLVVASGASNVLSSSRKWTKTDVNEDAQELASMSLATLVASASGSSSKYTIPKTAQAEAKKALKWRKEEKRGGTPVGLNTARRLAEGGQIGIEKVRHIAKYFPRHEVDKKAEGWKPGEDGFPSNGRIAWALWGGDTAWRWAQAIVDREEKKAVTAGGYELKQAPAMAPELDDFDVEYEDSSPVFMTRVRLDGSGMDRLYKIDPDNSCYVWDDGTWEDFGHGQNGDIWLYDQELDYNEDECEKTHIDIDPASAVIIAARLYASPYRPVTVEQIDELEASLVKDAFEDIDWAFMDKTILAAGEVQAEEQDGEYTPDERAENAAQQVRDKQGRFAKIGSPVVVAGDPVKGRGVITKLNPATRQVTVRLGDGKEVSVDGSLVEKADLYPTQGWPADTDLTAPPIDTSGILGEPRTPINRSVAQLPGTLPAMTSRNLSDMLSNWPAWVKSQRDSFIPGRSMDKVGVKPKDSLDTGNAEADKALVKDAYDHPLLKTWLKGKDRLGYKNAMWYNPITASGEAESLVNPDTTDVQPVYMAVVDPDDPRAVLALVSLVPASSQSTSPMVYKRNEGKWERDPKTLADLGSPTPPPVVPLNSETLDDVLQQVDMTQGVAEEKPESVTASIALAVLFGESMVAAGGADRNRGNAEKLRIYWTKGPGAAKIRWGQGGDWKRCVRQLSKYMGVRAKGYCQLRHKEVLGYYTSTHAKMERAKNSSIAVPGEEDDLSIMDFTEVTEEDMHTPLSSIFDEIDPKEDVDWQPDEDIILILSDQEALDYEEYSLIAAGGADRNRGGAENLRKYWTRGKGAAKIRWGTKGDWTRCVRQLKKYMGPRAKGYCALRHKEMNGIWPGDRRNQTSIMASAEMNEEFIPVKSSEQIIQEASLRARAQELKARVGIVAGADVSVNNFFIPEPIYRIEDMENVVENEEPVDLQEIEIDNLIPTQDTVDIENVEDVMDSEKPVSVLITEDGPLLVDGHHRTAAYRLRGEDEIPAEIYKAIVSAGAYEVNENTYKSEGASFSIPLVIPEEMESGDGRKFKKGAIEIRELPLPLLWQIKTGAGHDGSVVVGRIDRMERTENGIGNAHGVFDSGEYGQEAERLVREGFIRGVSADMDKFEAAEEVEEEVVAASEEGEEDTTIKKEKIVISKARVMAVTIVPKPAFQECKIFLVNNEETESPEEDEMIPDGIYVEDVDPNDAEAIVASGMIAGAIPTEPPAEWFENPKLKQPTPLTVSENGHVFGHIAAWNVDHIGMAFGTKPPRSRSGYAYFHTGVVRTMEGTDIPVGQITLAGGHADIRANAAQAVKHYDDTASAIIDCHAGEDQYGIWVAGALRPGTTPEQVRALRASAPSGDWRPIQGRLELVAVCQVNVPGFPIARAMVAGGQVMALVAAGASTLARLRHNPMEELAMRIAKLEGTDPVSLANAAEDARAKFNSLMPEVVSMPNETGDFYEDVTPTLVKSLEQTLADVVALSFLAQGYHWNVKGENFPQYHELFGDIYSDIYSSVDPMAENILKLGYDAPFTIASLANMSELSGSATMENSCQAMAYDLYLANQVVTQKLKEAFAVAEAANEQGVADFLAGRIDMHQKWGWQLKASTQGHEMPSSEAEVVVEEPYEEYFEMTDFSDRSTLVANFSMMSEFKTFSPEEREKLAKEGAAMKDGSYPIRNKADLKNAIQAFGRAKNKAATKKHIVKRAKALGETELIPEEWNFSAISVDDLRSRVTEFSSKVETAE